MDGRAAPEGLLPSPGGRRKHAFRASKTFVHTSPVAQHPGSVIDRAGLDFGSVGVA